MTFAALSRVNCRAGNREHLTSRERIGYLTPVSSHLSFYQNKLALVTGGIGFIGSNLAIRLVEMGARVTLVDAMLPAYGARLFSIEPIRDRVRINFCDLRDTSSVKQLVRGHDVIFSLAGQVSHIQSMEDPANDLEINCRSHLSLLEACRAENCAARIVLASTRQVYGRPNHLPVNELHPTTPADINGIHKLATESYYRLYHKRYGLPSAILRLTNTYGPRMDLVTPEKGVIGVFLRRALRGERLQLFGNGEQRRDFNYVDDVVDALVRAGATDAAMGETFNLGHHESRSLRQFVEVLQHITGCRFELAEFPPAQRAIDIGDYHGDFEKFRLATGWRPTTDLEPGLRHTIDFFRRHAAEYWDVG